MLLSSPSSHQQSGYEGLAIRKCWTSLAYTQNYNCCSWLLTKNVDINQHYYLLQYMTTFLPSTAYVFAVRFCSGSFFQTKQLAAAYHLCPRSFDHVARWSNLQLTGPYKSGSKGHKHTRHCYKMIGVYFSGWESFFWLIASHPDLINLLAGQAAVCKFATTGFSIKKCLFTDKSGITLAFNARPYTKVLSNLHIRLNNQIQDNIIFTIHFHV